MTEKNKYDKLFVKFDEFFDNLHNIYPHEKDFYIYQNRIWMGKQTLGKSEVCERIAQSLMIFEHEIKHEDCSFFMDNPLDKASAIDGHDALIVKIKTIWNTCSDKTQTNVWRYLQSFVGIIRDIYSEIELTYIKIKGFIGLISSEMINDPAGQIIYWQYLKLIKMCQTKIDTEFIIDFSNFLQKHKHQLKNMKKSENFQDFLSFDPIKFESSHSGFLDWLQHNWSNYNILIRTACFHLFMSVIRTSQIIRNKN
jgi:hypothetical protein